MSENTEASKKETEFALAALMEIPFQFRAAQNIQLTNSEPVHYQHKRPLPPPKEVIDHDNAFIATPRMTNFKSTEPTAPASEEPVCPICLTNPKDMAFGCGHTIFPDVSLMKSWWKGMGLPSLWRWLMNAYRTFALIPKFFGHDFAQEYVAKVVASTSKPDDRIANKTKVVQPLVYKSVCKQMVQYTNAANLAASKEGTWLLAHNYIEQPMRVEIHERDDDNPREQLNVTQHSAKEDLNVQKATVALSMSSDVKCSSNYEGVIPYL
ncbi:E3 ubiquitin-protein ligase rglg1-like protein [Trifolium pratense]|uniref:E3 ubiquitin-protein ligase rglg1-like protein n=1 Tax=Trifolium pratense TaxID=57577 RepID=A0A2K3L4I1_TRIPR|nr:E3 ubiquitin-protein ligase rglg1-like protein [Trifolium pratense]